MMIRRKFTKPRKVISSLQQEVEAAVSILLDEAETTLSDWRFYVTDTRRGRCWLSSRFMSIPLWAYRRGTDYFLYYVSHEMAHAIGTHKDHGPAFMKDFKRICPPNLWHYETAYKPRNAAAAGISKKQDEEAKKFLTLEAKTGRIRMIEV